MHQVGTDSQLLETARDFFHFVTKFFEPINVSATHIYHSALELSPISSIVRTLYYDRRSSIARLPRVVIGNADSWDQTISFSNKDDYKHCIWSPCGRFIAAHTKAVVEIRNQHTFQLLVALKTPKEDSLLKGPLAYSPDGRSIACGFSDGIVIWDIQTGGVARSINSRSNIFSLAWSLDGKAIASSLHYSEKFSAVNAYDVASGARIFEENLKKEWVFDLWANENFFRFISTQVPLTPDPKFSISEIGPAHMKTEPLPVVASSPVSIRFSPSTYRISLSGRDTLHILDARNLRPLLQERHKESISRFSSDAGLFAAPHEKGFRVWKYTSDGYVLVGEYLLPHIPSFSREKLRLEFSPDSTSILTWYRNVLQVWRLQGPPTTPQTRHQHAAISRSGRYIATAHQSQSTVAITDMESQTISQFIDTGGEIEGLVITGNVLLVVFSEKVVGWLLTGQGTVEGVVDGGRAGQIDSLWTVASPLQHPKSLCYRVGGQVGVIGTDSIIPFIYHTETGGVPNRVLQPQHFGFPWISFYQLSDYQEYHYIRHHDTLQCGTSPEDGWLAPRTETGKEGWVIDPEGRHRFWVPVEWRTPWDHKNWHHDVTTLFSRRGDQPFIIKF